MTKPSAVTEYKHYVTVGGVSVAIRTLRSNGVNDTRYLHADHLGGVDTITNDSGALVTRLSYSAFGGRRSSATWSATPGSGEWGAIASVSHRGFTSHEGIDNVGLIHMNGRVYDPMIGRFLSADPVIPGRIASQSTNRYSYVGNNPLSVTDPTGFADVEGEVTVTSSRTSPTPSSGDPDLQVLSRDMNPTNHAVDQGLRRDNQLTQVVAQASDGVQEVVVCGGRCGRPQEPKPYLNLSYACVKTGYCVAPRNLTTKQFVIETAAVDSLVVLVFYPEALIYALSNPVTVTNLTVGAADTAAGGVLGGGAALATKEIGRRSNSWQEHSTSSRRDQSTGASQADAVKLIEKVVQASGREGGRRRQTC